MAIFSKSLPKQLADATASAAKLAQRLADAERAVTDHRQAAEGLALAGAPDEKLDATEAQMRASIDRATTLKAALRQAEVAVADLERERDEQADRALREKTSVETEALARRVTEGCAKLVADADALADWTSRAAAVVPEAGGVLNFCQIVSREIPQASELISKLLRAHAASVIAGHAASSLPQPMQPFVEVLPPAKEPTQVVFALRSVRWVDAEGVQRLGGQYQDCELPVRIIGKALKSGRVVPVTDERRAKLQSQGGPPQRIDLAFDLDAYEPRLGPPIYASAPEGFTVVDRGPPVPMKVVR